MFHTFVFLELFPLLIRYVGKSSKLLKLSYKGNTEYTLHYSGVTQRIKHQYLQVVNSEYGKCFKGQSYLILLEEHTYAPYFDLDSLQHTDIKY